MDVPEEMIVKFLEPTIKVNGIEKDVDQYGFYTGVRKLRVEVEDIKHIPHIHKVGEYPTLITMPGRPLLCLRCGFIGHVRQNCITPYCRHCERYGHSTEECVPTYANTLTNRSAPQRQARRRRRLRRPHLHRPRKKVPKMKTKKNYKNQKEPKKPVSSSTDDDAGEWQVATGRKKRTLTKKPSQDTHSRSQTMDINNIQQQRHHTDTNTDTESELQTGSSSTDTNYTEKISTEVDCD